MPEDDQIPSAGSAMQFQNFLLNAVLLNAGAAIYIATDGITIEQGIEKAKEMITSGKAKAKLEQFIEDSNK